MRKNKIKQQERILLDKKISDAEPENNLFCYLRVSTQEQNDKNHSIDRQRTYGKKIAKKLGKNYIEMNEGGTSSVERKDDTKFKFLQTLITDAKLNIFGITIEVVGLEHKKKTLLSKGHY